MYWVDDDEESYLPPPVLLLTRMQGAIRGTAQQQQLSASVLVLISSESQYQTRRIHKGAGWRSSWREGEHHARERESDAGGVNFCKRVLWEVRENIQEMGVSDVELPGQTRCTGVLTGRIGIWSSERERERE